MPTSAHTLYSIVLSLTPVREVTIGATMGHQTHAAFLTAVREVDPELSEAIHAPNASVRPFTVSPLRGIPRARDGRVRLSPDRDCWLRFTVLQAPIYERFMARFLQAGSRPVIRLGGAELLIREILTTGGAHPWSGYTTWAELVDGASPEPEIRMSFASPTAFGFGQKEWGKQVVVLPNPEPVFGSLVRSWNQLSPPELQVDQDGLRTYLREHTVVKRVHRLETQMLQFRRSAQVGFVGDITYGLMLDDDTMLRQINALADFAFYAGVGMKTAMGMGQCRRVRREGNG